MLTVVLSDEAPIYIVKTPINMNPLFAIHRIIKQRHESLPLHAHDEGQLTFAASGMVQVHTDKGIWLVPPRLAAWIPSGSHHRIEMLTDSELWIIHWQLAAIRKWGDHNLLSRAFALQITPFLHSLLTEMFSISPVSKKMELLVRLILGEFIAMPDAPTFLPMPVGIIGRRAADIIIADQRNLLKLDEIALRAVSSVRTLSRLFPIETGLTFKAWRQRARIVRAMEQLGRGDALATAAHNNGFASTAAFSCAFRQVTAMTPTAFLKSSSNTFVESMR